jgi:hypothetical protein
LFCHQHWYEFLQEVQDIQQEVRVGLLQVPSFYLDKLCQSHIVAIGSKQVGSSVEALLETLDLQADKESAQQPVDPLVGVFRIPILCRGFVQSEKNVLSGSDFGVGFELADIVGPGRQLTELASVQSLDGCVHYIDLLSVIHLY